MRLSDAGLRQRKTKLIYPDHRLPPWLNEDAPRDRSNRLLDGSADDSHCATFNGAHFDHDSHARYRSDAQEERESAPP
jgi:hypothetical protein